MSQVNSETEFSLSESPERVLTFLIQELWRPFNGIEGALELIGNPTIEETTRQNMLHVAKNWHQMQHALLKASETYLKGRFPQEYDTFLRDSYWRPK